MNRLILIFIITPFLLLSACQEQIKSNMSETIPDFEFITQDHESIGPDDLKGEWWIANFMYTNCQKICPVMTRNMSSLLQTLKENDLSIKIVSFTVDPEFDTPEVLKEYAREHQADLNLWSFVTGYDFETIQDLSKNTFLMHLYQASPGTGDDQIAHATSFFLVNPDGKVIKKYDGIGKNGIEEAVKDIGTIH